jgi:pyridoxal phosphate enzyme (YggS family)
MLIVVTKFRPESDVRLLYELGIRDVGESRDQEAADKARALEGLSLRWHFIGQLQTNKAKSVARYAYAVHSVDRTSLVDALSRAVVMEQDQTGRADLLCYVQVNLDENASQMPGARGGALPDDVLGLAAHIAAAPGLELAGVMAVSPLLADPSVAFAKLELISKAMVARYPQATGISAGMSQDLEEAIYFGSTHLRVGSDVLGTRPPIR